MTCHACGAPLAATAKFCHKCGAQVGGGQAAAWRLGLPWGVAGAALGALLTVVVFRPRTSGGGGGRPPSPAGRRRRGAPAGGPSTPSTRTTSRPSTSKRPRSPPDARVPARRTIRLAHSPDADDAFMFWALAAGKIDTGTRHYQHELADIETLNRRALKGELEVTAVSLHAYAHLADRYALLAHGASVGDRYGH